MDSTKAEPLNGITLDGLVRRRRGMLVLSRKIGERIVIGPPENPVVVIVQAIERGRVRLTVDADRSISIVRQEDERRRP